MTISARTSKMLWGRAAARCSMPHCRALLVLDETSTASPGLVGEMAHIVGEKKDGPRGNSPLTDDQRNEYKNLILLCRNHHGEIDQQPEIWPVDRLHGIKMEHETWVRNSLPNFDSARQFDDELYAGYIDEWGERCHIDQWTEWTSGIFSLGQPSVPLEVHTDLREICRWILKRIWPGRYKHVERSMNNFALVCRDFINIFDQHATKLHDNALITRKFYQVDNWDRDQYHRLLRIYEHHVDLVQDLGLELTRAANWVCDCVRTDLLRSYRLKEGRLSIQSGPHSDFKWKEWVVEYDEMERLVEQPYPGLTTFITVRASRDSFFGSGPAPE